MERMWQTGQGPGHLRNVLAESSLGSLITICILKTGRCRGLQPGTAEWQVEIRRGGGGFRKEPVPLLLT